MPGLARLRLVLLAALVAVLLAELVLGRTDLVGWIVPGGGAGNMVYLEDRVVQGSEDPAVLIFGTSRARGAFLPTRMEQALGLPRGAVLNLALGGASIFDAAIVYRRSHDALRKAHTVIVQVDPFQFNAGPKPDSRIRRFGSWSDRMAYRGAHRLLLQWEYVFRLNTVLPDLAVLARQVLTTGVLPPRPGIDQFGRLAVVRIADDHSPQQFEDPRLRYWLDWQYDQYWYSPGLEQMLLDLIEAAHADGSRVFVVMMPTSARYYELLGQYPGDPYRKFLDRLETVIGPLVDGVGVWTTAEEAGLAITDFRDWGHLNTAGAGRWSVIFSEWLRQQDSTLYAPRNVRF